LFSLDGNHRLKFFLCHFEKKLRKYLAGVKKVLTFASAKRGNAPFAEGPLLCPRKVKRSLKGLHRQNEVVQEAMAVIFVAVIG